MGHHDAHIARGTQTSSTGEDAVGAPAGSAGGGMRWRDGRTPEGARVLEVGGTWTLPNVEAISRRLKRDAGRKAGGHGGGTLVLDLSALAQLDTAGALLLTQTAGELADGEPVGVVGAASAHEQLLRAIARNAPPGPADGLRWVFPGDAGAMVPHRGADGDAMSDAISGPGWQRRGQGRAVRSGGARVGARGGTKNLAQDRAQDRAQDDAGDLPGLAAAVSIVGLLGALAQATLRTMVSPARFRWTAFISHLERVGLHAVPIVALTCAVVGGVLMHQGAVQLSRFGAEVFSINMLAILALRELGILLTAIMVAGRSGSAFTAEIGAMKMREEIDAMRTLGLDPVEMLVLPRAAALIVALPLLTFIGNVAALAGGAIVAVTLLEYDLAFYVDRLHATLTINNLLVGLIKAPFVALAIALVGCADGLRVAGSAASLGHQVTAAVVKSIFIVILIDAFFAIFLSNIGL